MAKDAAKTKPPQKSSPVKTGYLILYNAVSAVLWAGVLERTITANINGSYHDVFPAVGELVQWTQTLMIVDVLHALLGTFKLPFYELPSAPTKI